MYEDESLPADIRNAAALLASKVYYFLSEYEEALSFALGAGSAFENETRAPGSEEYVETVICAYTTLFGKSSLTSLQLRPSIAISSYGRTSPKDQKNP